MPRDETNAKSAGQDYCRLRPSERSRVRFGLHGAIPPICTRNCLTAFTSMAKQTSLAPPTDVCLDLFVFAEFLSQNRCPLLGNSA
jgi:hypothetical protein